MDNQCSACSNKTSGIWWHITITGSGQTEKTKTFCNACYGNPELMRRGWKE